MFWFNKKNNIAAVASGILLDISDSKDEAISAGALGVGYLIRPADSKVVSPIDGEIAFLFPTLHALGIKGTENEVLIHIGIDTVNLNGEGFHPNIQKGQKVKMGEVLMTVDFELIKKKNLDTDIAVLFTNRSACSVINPGRQVAEGEINIVKL